MEDVKQVVDLMHAHSSTNMLVADSRLSWEEMRNFLQSRYAFAFACGKAGSEGQGHACGANKKRAMGLMMACTLAVRSDAVGPGCHSSIQPHFSRL